MQTNTSPAAAPEPSGFLTSLRLQSRLLASGGPWLFLVVGLLVLLALAVLSDPPPGVPLLLVVAIVGLPSAVLWPLVVWRDEPPSRRAYHWSLPVARPVHDLARVTAGGFYLLAAWVVLAAAGAGAAALDGSIGAVGTVGPEGWANLFVAPLVVYLLVTPLVLWSDYPVTRWAVGSAAGLGIAAALLEVTGGAVELDLGWLGRVLGAIAMGEDRGLGAALFGGMLRELLVAAGAGGPTSLGSLDAALVPPRSWWPAALLWLALGLGATVAAATWRPDDLRRAASGHLRGGTQGAGEG